MTRRRRPEPPPEPEHAVVGAYTGSDHRGPRTVYSPAEVRAQKQLVEQMLAQGYTAQGIHSAIARSREQTPLDGVSLPRVRKLAAEVEELWAKEDEADRPKAKMRQIRRLQDAINLARNGRRDAKGAWVTKPNLSALARLEELLAKIQGTLAPIEVKLDVHIAHAVQHVIADMTADDVAEAIATYEENARAAREYRAMLAAGKVLTTPMGQEVLPAREEPSRRTG